MVVRVLPRLRDPRGAAEREGDEGALEVRALAPDQVRGPRHRDHVPQGLVVGGEHDHVRLAALTMGSFAASEEKATQRQASVTRSAPPALEMRVWTNPLGLTNLTSQWPRVALIEGGLPGQDSA